MLAVEYLLRRNSCHAIMVAIFQCHTGNCLNGTGMQIILQTPFLRQHGTAMDSSIDLSNNLFPLLSLRGRFPVIEIKLGELERGQPPDPGSGMSADGQKDEFPVPLHRGKVR